MVARLGLASAEVLTASGITTVACPSVEPAPTKKHVAKAAAKASAGRRPKGFIEAVLQRHGRDAARGLWRERASGGGNRGGGRRMPAAPGAGAPYTMPKKVSRI